MIKLYVLTGFLGAGKTTFLKNVIENLDGKKIGVIQNEFGKLSIDGDILKNEDIQMVELTRGSIFCSCLQLSFARAMAEMAMKDIDYLFVESSGLGDPSNLHEILDGVKELAGDVYEFAGVICLVDAVNFTSQLDDLETVTRQIKHCNMAVINKIDLVEDNNISSVKEKIHQINSMCLINSCSFGKLTIDFLNQDITINGWVEGEDTTNSVETKPKTISLNFESEIEKDVLIQFLNSVLNDAYRIKGFFKLSDGWSQVDVVGNKIDFKPCESHDISQLVFISRIGPNIIKTIASNWDKITNMKMTLKN